MDACFMTYTSLISVIEGLFFLEVGFNAAEDNVKTQVTDPIEANASGIV